MNADTSPLSHIERFLQERSAFLQVHRFFPDCRLIMETSILSEEGEPQLLCEPEYPAHEGKLRRRFDRDVAAQPPGMAESPAYLEVSGPEESRRYSRIREGEVSEAFSELLEYTARIVSCRRIPS